MVLRLPSGTAAAVWLLSYLKPSADADMFQSNHLLETDRMRLVKLIDDFDALAVDIAYRRPWRRCRAALHLRSPRTAAAGGARSSGIMQAIFSMVYRHY